MNRWQKIAWFNLIVMTVCLAACFVLAIAVSFRQAAIPPTPLSLVIIPSLVLVAISKFIFRKRDEQVDFDERDRQIHKKSQYVGLWAFFLATTIAITVEVMICFFVAGPRGAPPYPLVLLLTICIGGCVWIAVESIAILVQYGLGGKDGGK
jgi:purine-cytosine permease-like protein